MNRSPCCEKSASLPPSRESTTSAPPDVDRKAAVLAQAETLTGIRVTESLLQDGTYELGLVPASPRRGEPGGHQHHRCPQGPGNGPREDRDGVEPRTGGGRRAGRGPSKQPITDRSEH
ncbi:DUF6461 domain-containing protein [Streptomyces sp. NPDC018947]|uniref:DUF6461 domain-containing protein n=1 Tax=Streptomyces sp. NPDC018947 TaxID=3365054 RepID=UPI0037A69130